MTIRGLDPSGELGKLFLQIQSKDIHARETNPSRTLPSGASPDAVDLSVLAQEIHNFTSQASTVPELRTDRIQHVQQALESGTNLATSRQLADALLRETILNALGS